MRWRGGETAAGNSLRGGGPHAAPASHRLLLIAAGTPACQDVKFALLLNQLHLHRVTHLRPWLATKSFSI